MGLVFGVVEILERVLGEAFVFIGVGQRDGGHVLMPVSTVDQFVEFSQSVFEVVEAAHALCCLLFKLEIELENAKIEEEKPREADTTEHTACDQSFESDRLVDKSYNEEGSVQHIKHLIQYFSS